MTVLARFFIALIGLYRRVLSPLLGQVCRFEPSCSRYAEACLAEYGAFRGGLLSLVRLCKCHPFHPGGYDPPPLPPRAPTISAKADSPAAGYRASAGKHDVLRTGG